MFERDVIVASIQAALDGVFQNLQNGGLPFAGQRRRIKIALFNAIRAAIPGDYLVFSGTGVTLADLAPPRRGEGINCGSGPPYHSPLEGE
ncbi:MAG: hypothetical protein OXP66_01785 [Candidatus Tectomicrobia bacterium]|nr:hypothetical protein [Candidatus Tectomicrobia bacterium]